MYLVAALPIAKRLKVTTSCLSKPMRCFLPARQGWDANEKQRSMKEVGKQVQRCRRLEAESMGEGEPVEWRKSFEIRMRRRQGFGFGFGHGHAPMNYSVTYFQVSIVGKYGHGTWYGR